MTQSRSDTPFSQETRWPRGLLHRGTWLRVFCYALFIFSTLSMAGMEMAVVMLYALGLYDLWRAGPTRGLPRWVVWSFPALAAIAVFSSLVGEDTLSSLNEIKSEYRIFLPLLMLPALAATDPRRLLKVYAALLGLVAVYAFFQFGWDLHHKRFGGNLSLLAREASWGHYVSGTFTNYLTLGGIMLMPGCVFAALALKDRSADRRWWLLGTGAAAWIVLASQARSAWLGLGMGWLVLVLMLPRRIAWPIITGTLAAGILLAYLLASGWVWETFKDRVDNQLVIRFIQTRAERDTDRILLWQAALRGIADAPVFGHGSADGPFNRYREAIAKERNFSWDMENLRAHNTLLRIGFSFGLAGLAIFLWMWFGVMAWCARAIRRIPSGEGFEAGVLWGVAAALAGSLVQGWFGNHFFDGEINVAIMMWMGLGVFMGLRVSGGTASSQ